MNKKLLIVIGIIVGLAITASIVGYFTLNPKNTVDIGQINSFEECVAAGYPILESYPEQCKTPDGRTFVHDISLRSATFGTSVSLVIGERVKFSDDLKVTLTEINDSRCKDGVTCIWAGELSPLLNIVGGSVGESLKEVRLGTTTAKTLTKDGYIFILKEATETTAIIEVTKEIVTPPGPTPAPSTSAITINGQITCLPHRNTSGPQTMECAIGLKGNDGLYYGLKNLPNYEFSTSGMRVRVSGTLTAGGLLDKYAIVGTIDVSSIVSVPADESQVYLKEGEKEGPFLLQKIYPTYITGLVYYEYPVARSEGSPITLKIGDSVSNGCTVTLTLTDINPERVTFTEKTDYNRPCPICLSEGTLIDTPKGQIAAEDLKQGMEVWTTDIFGKRVVGKILLTVKTPVPATHKIVHLTLDDGRELFVSPGHPTADGRLAGVLSAGDTLNGTGIKTAKLIPYTHKFTYDILPAGATGQYWANGILMGSTLFRD